MDILYLGVRYGVLVSRYFCIFKGIEFVIEFFKGCSPSRMALTAFESHIIFLSLKEIKNMMLCLYV